jgi:hypothetical protein
MSKKTYKQRNGTTRIGDFLRNLNLSKIAGVGVELLEGDLAGALKVISGGSDELSEDQRAYAIQLLELDIVESQAVTRRWEADLYSRQWLPSNIRPLTLAFLTLLLAFVIITDSYSVSFNVDSGWIDLMKSLLMTVFTAYFAGRSYEKSKRL